MKKVWIVDDDEEMIGAIRLMLKLLDCEERHFFSARPAAQALLDGERPDICILDINMPEVSGLDFLEFIRRREDLKDLPVVMLSTEAADVMVDKAMATRRGCIRDQAGRARGTGKSHPEGLRSSRQNLRIRNKGMAKGKQRLTSTQRQARTYRIIFIAISVIILLTMVLSWSPSSN